jgi:integrase
VRLELPAGLDGHRRRIRRGGYPSRKAAAAVLARLRAPRPGDTGARMLTVGDWLVSRTAIAPSTVRGYTAHVRLYLGPYLGEVLLAELSVAQVQAMFAAIIRQHHALGTPVSAATLTRIRATLRAALNAAIRRGLLTENPAARAELPRARRPRAVVWTPYRFEQWRRTGEQPAVAVWTATQTAQFLRSIEDHRLYAAYHLIALRGLRRGEAAGLRWCDIDLDGKTAVISQQLQQYDGRLAICPPKTAHSTRVIALDHTTIAALRAHWDRQCAEAAAYGPGYRASGFVFTNLNGDPMAPDRLTRTFRRLTAEAGLPARSAARSPARGGDAGPGGGGGPAGGAGDARPLEHRADRRHLHLGAARRGAHRSGEGRRADHPGGLPGARHPAPSAAAGHPGPSPCPGRRQAGHNGAPVTSPSGPPARPPEPPAPPPQTRTVTAPSDALRRPQGPLADQPIKNGA